MTDEYEDEAKESVYTADDLKRIGAKWIDRIRASEKRDVDWFKDAEKAETAYLCDTSNDAEGHVPEFNILHSNVETIVPSIYNSTPAPDIRPRHNARDEIGKAVSDVLERVISTQIDDNRLDAEIEANAQDAFMAGRGIVRIKFDADVDEVTQVVSNENLIFEVVSWRDYREGPAKRWSGVQWVAYREFVTTEEMDRITDKDLPEHVEPVDTDEELDEAIWQIWCKETRKVYFVGDSNSKVLAIRDDPFSLPGFFPQPQPIQPITGTGKRTPVCPYKVYQTLAEELDRTTRRIDGIMKGLKVRGVIAGDASIVEIISDLDDNELAPVENLEGLVAAGGLDKAVMWWPIDMAITVLRELHLQREQTKQTIYEITGISDIVRGASNSGETATAQQIKTQWGSLRIKKMQRLVERQVRDLFVISAEIISQKFSIESLQRMSGIEITPEMQQILKSPLDHYRIDVESDSTIRADASKNREEMSAFLNGTAEFFGAMAPIVAQAPQAAGPVVEMYSAFARQFNLGKQAEDALEQFAEMAKQAAQNPPPNPEAEAMKAEMDLKMAEIELKKGDQQIKQGEMQGRLQSDSMKQQLDIQKGRLDVQLKVAELKLKERELGIKENEAILNEAVAEVDAAAKFAELEMEDEQLRAVKIGDN